MDGYMDVWEESWLAGLINQWMRWMDGWVDRWMDECMGEWLHGWIIG